MSEEGIEGASTSGPQLNMTLTDLMCSEIKCQRPEVFVKGAVCKDADIKDNEMKTFNLEGHGEILLVRQNGNLSALGTKCTHYGAPLINGALGNNRIRCPWHGACFNITTGDIEEFPGLDSLPCYQVSVVEDDVVVEASISELESNKRVKEMAKYNAVECEKSFVIIGGGPAGAVCVETLRQEGFVGRIALICKEDCLPYDRVKVSKAMDVPIGKLELRDEQFYVENAIEVLKNTEATEVDIDRQVVTVNTGRVLRYDQLFIATGSTPAKPNIPGLDLRNIFVLRNHNDSKLINSCLCKHKEVVVLGGSFIAAEVASYCVNKVKRLTVVMRKKLLLQPLLGPKIAEAVTKLFEANGVNFIANSNIKSCIDDGTGAIGRIELKSGVKMKADILILGTGSSFNTEFLKGSSGIKLQKDGSIVVNELLQTNIPNIYAGGDIAFAPVSSNKNQKQTIGHFGLAHSHGRIAALNMLEKETPLKVVPYFWTMLFGKSIRYAGSGDFTSIVYSGKVDQMQFVAFYLKKDLVVAASSCMMDPYVSKFAERLEQGIPLCKKDLKKNPLDWSK